MDLYKLDFIDGKLYCPHCSIVDIDSGALFILKCLAREYKKKFNKPIWVTSGGRCPVCNSKVGGNRNSAHKVIEVPPRRSFGFDIWINNSSKKRGFIMIALVKMGVTRFGFAKGFLHWDVGPENLGYPQPSAWLYG